MSSPSCFGRSRSGPASAASGTHSPQNPDANRTRLGATSSPPHHQLLAFPGSALQWEQEVRHSSPCSHPRAAGQPAGRLTKGSRAYGQLRPRPVRPWNECLRARRAFVRSNSCRICHDGSGAQENPPHTPPPPEHPPARNRLGCVHNLQSALFPFSTECWAVCCRKGGGMVVAVQVIRPAVWLLAGLAGGVATDRSRWYCPARRSHVAGGRVALP